MWADVEEGVYDVRWWPGALRETIEAARAARLEVGLADASLVALAAHIGSTRVATLDEAHFRQLEPLGGAKAFTLLPADDEAA